MTDGMPTREEVARALAKADGYDFDKLAPEGFFAQPRFTGKDYWLGQADAVLALMQPDEAMVERGARALCGYGWEHSMTEEARQEYRDNARACLTAALDKR